MAKTHEYVILFLYHKHYDPTTWRHFALMQYHNPGVPIVPIIDGGINELPGTVDVKDFPSRWFTDDLLIHPDTLLYRWFENRKLSAKRYVLAEYDVYCETSFPDFMSDVWDDPMAGHSTFNYDWWPTWNWFIHDQQEGNIPDDLRKHLAAICTFGFMLFSHKALEVIVKNATPSKLFCETRVATTCRKMGIPISVMKKSLDTISYRQTDLKRQPFPSIYHPVKSLEQKIPLD